MSKRSQTTLHKFVGSQYRGKPVSIYKLTKDYGLSLSEVNRLVDAMLKNGKLKQTPDGFVPGKPVETRKKKRVTEEEFVVPELKRKTGEPQYLAFSAIPSKPPTQEEAKKILDTFYAKFGQSAEHIEHCGSCVLVGPVPEEFMKG